MIKRNIKKTLIFHPKIALKTMPEAYLQKVVEKPVRANLVFRRSGDLGPQKSSRVRPDDLLGASKTHLLAPWDPSVLLLIVRMVSKRVPRSSCDPSGTLRRLPRGPQRPLQEQFCINFGVIFEQLWGVFFCGTLLASKPPRASAGCAKRKQFYY